MATAVYGGSPRHHQQSRMLVNPSGSAPSLQPQTQHQMTAGNASNIIVPPSPYLSSPSSLQHYHHNYGHSGNSFYHGTSSSAQLHHSPHMPNPIYASQRNFKRKSAVELLAETKAYYVKSETVLDRHQQLYRSGNLAPTSYMVSPSRTLTHHRDGSNASSLHHAGLSPHSAALHLPAQPQPQQRSTHTNRRSSSSSSDLLQTKLRKLLNTSDSKETITPDLLINPLTNKYSESVGLSSPHCSGTIGQSFGYSSPKVNDELTIQSDNSQNDVSVFFPSAFLSPQSLPPHPASDDDIYSYGIDENLILTDDYRAISPPSEYAGDNTSDKNGASIRYNYQRSYSHSQAVAKKEPEYSPSYNINSHKSLPDLHSQISRHSPHSEALSCCSRGNRSNKSGSSFNRDSGGSSGHYTHRSEPANCCKQGKEIQGGVVGGDFRRDSGSSTQHSGNSYYAYGIPPLRYDCMECRAKMKNDADCLLNFTTPEVPEAFQDDYEEKSRRYYEAPNRNNVKYATNVLSKQQQQQQQNQTETTTPVNDNELSPPLGTFKRQKCLRFKHRGRYSSASDDRRPILRSKSDISDRYLNRNAPIMEAAAKAKEMRSKSESMSQLEHFFDRLGLNDEHYEEFIAPKAPNTPNFSDDNDSDQSSPVFFSDVSTVDSTRLPDSTETQPQVTAPYRPNEPPSIVERNARIIKWLCNCRKLQLV